MPLDNYWKNALVLQSVLQTDCKVLLFPMFIPTGFNKTLGEIDYAEKNKFSHRSKALVLAKKVLEVIL